MKIELVEYSINEVSKNYVDNQEEGVVGFSGKLNIRPKYQREFVYDEKKRNAVIETINNGFPLNVMYWVKNEDNNYELLDGQQRTISFCQYIIGDFSFENRYFHNLTTTEKDKILNYKLMIYICEGNDKEKLDWFKIINISGERLTPQELRNAVYTGPWLTSAKSIFSKTMAPAYLLSKDYVNGSPIRQEILQTAIEWINKGNVEEYMSIHQHDSNANELWFFYKNVIEWVKLTFINYRKEMRGINWGQLYNEHKHRVLDTNAIENIINRLMIDDDVTNKKGIYSYVLNGEEKFLNIRAFTPNQKREAFERQKGICPICKKHFKIDEMEADHITPWSQGGKSNSENCKMLCRDCNRRKSDT
jgi:hypothetical protein